MDELTHPRRGTTVRSMAAEFGPPPGAVHRLAFAYLSDMELCGVPARATIAYGQAWQRVAETLPAAARITHRVPLEQLPTELRLLVAAFKHYAHTEAHNWTSGTEYLRFVATVSGGQRSAVRRLGLAA